MSKGRIALVYIAKTDTFRFRDFKTGRWASKAQFQAQYIKPPLKVSKATRAKISRSMKQYWAEKKAKEKKIEKPEFMWRCTMTATVYKSGQRDHKPVAFRATAWSLSKEQAQELCEKAFADHCKSAMWREFNENPNVSLEQILLDETLLNKVTTGI